MKKVLSIIISAAMLLSVTAGLNLTASADEIYQMTFGQSEARKLTALVNEIRANDAWYWNETDTEKVYLSNLQPLTYDYALEKVAMQRAAEIAISFSHTRPNGSSCFTAYGDYSYDYSSAGENIARGCHNAYTTAESVNVGWAEADESYSGQGHRRNMLDKKYTAFAVGHIYYNGWDFWVEEFSSEVKDGNLTSANDSTVNVKLDGNNNVYIDYGSGYVIPTTTTTTATTTTQATTESTTTSTVKKPKSTSIKSLKKGKKQIKATWKKVSGVKGYQVQVATDKKFKKNKKTVTIKKQKTTSTTIKKLKSNKKYYVRVRTYKTVNGDKVYSSWSKVKTVKTK